MAAEETTPAVRSRHRRVGGGPPPRSSPGRRTLPPPIQRGRDWRVAASAALCTLALLLSASAVRAQDTPELSFDAYGTAGLVYSTEERADFIWNQLRPEGPGHSQTVSPDVDSRLGAQLALRLTPELMAVAQAVTEQNHEDEYTPHLEWAYAQYSVAPEFTVRAGRRPLALFLVSEHRKVSYANPWLRPPVELYGLSPVFSADGLDLSYRLHRGEWTNRVRVAFGWTEEEFEDGSAEIRNAWAFENTLQRGGFTARAAFATGVLDIDSFDSLFVGFRAFGPEGRAIADAYEVDDTSIRFAAVGAEYDPGAWFGMAEVGWLDMNSVLGEKLGGYLTGGYRFGSVTPYATYSRVEALSETSADGLPLTGLPPELAETAATLNAGLNAILRQTPVQQNLAVGARWDVRPGVALKLQMDFVDMLGNSPGTFDNRRPDFRPGGSARLFSVATAFVF